MIVNLNEINIEIDDRIILKNVNFQINDGEFVYLIGKVGSGKSSLLKVIYGELRAKGKEAIVFDQNLKTIQPKNLYKLRRQLGVVFQDFQLLSDRTVYENLEFVLRVTEWKVESRKARINEVLEMVNLSDKINCYPHELSGGEQQRVSIARALLNYPKLLVADEPTGNLDKDTGNHIMQIFQNIKQQGTAIVMVTHNHHLLQEYPADSIYQCQDGMLLKMTSDELLNT